jgi:hypothetical protein
LKFHKERFPAPPSELMKTQPMQVQGKMIELMTSPTYRTFIERRTTAIGQPIDLGVLSIEEVTEHCYDHRIIPINVYFEFVKAVTPDCAKDFIELFKANKLEVWNFKAIKITILDHRRLCELLARLFPQQYKIGRPLALDNEICIFLNTLYDLTPQNYRLMTDAIDGISKLTFWQTVRERYGHMGKQPVRIEQSKERDKDERKTGKGVSPKATQGRNIVVNKSTAVGVKDDI